MKKSSTVGLLAAVACFLDADVMLHGAQGETNVEIVVTATRVETASRQVSSSVSVLGADRIEKGNGNTLSDVVRDLPGVYISRSGSAGAETSVHIRGAASGHTLFTIDGARMNDPVSIGNSYTLDHLLLNNIERIEILRGPQGPIYGSDAMGGVVNVITKKGEGPLSVDLSAKGGSYGTFEETIKASGGNSLMNYSVGVGRLDTDGISSAGKAYGNTEKDGYRNTSASLRFGLTPSEVFDLGITASYIDSWNALDNYGGPGGDDPNFEADYEQLFLKLSPRLILMDGFWEQKLGVSFAQHDRTYRNDPDATTFEYMRSSYDSYNLDIDWQHNLRFNEINTLVLGVETKEESGKSDYYSEGMFGPYTDIFSKQTARINSAYVQDDINLWDRWFSTLGLRVDEHSIAGSEVTYRAGSAYLFEATGTKIKATYGSAFKAPSLFQLYSSYGDESLDPEKSVGWDAGIEQNILGEDAKVGISYFKNDFRDLIEFNFVENKYGNVSEAEAKGVELFASVNLPCDIVLLANYTYTDTENKITGEELLRRPKNKYGFDITCQVTEKASIGVNVLCVGERKDLDPVTFETIDLDSYTLVNMVASYDVSKNVQVFARVDNLLDEEYEEVKGYGTPGLSGYGGVKMTF
ncbi:MAG: hypothetical protein A2283_18475 [Lentisphaerae bacterium RIFOXYA12_FULL_48_11]|nr:MAG: hypothetical protein A2283_18475 [Lentisphaerae bacterium RIFOXYA12_FULL_48_11]